MVQTFQQTVDPSNVNGRTSPVITVAPSGFRRQMRHIPSPAAKAVRPRHGVRLADSVLKRLCSELLVSNFKSSNLELHIELVSPAANNCQASH